MILPTNAFNWAALCSGLSTGDFIASLTPEREEELLKQYNEWRRSKGLAEEKALAPAQAAVPAQKPEARVDTLSALFSQVADEVVAEEAALVQDALEGADGIVEEELETHAPVPAEVEEEAAQLLQEEAQADESVEEEELVSEDYAPKAATTPTVTADAEPAVDFATVIRSLPKEADLALYNHIKVQFGAETLTLAQAALKEATAKHRGTAAIRTFIAWLEQ